MCHNVDCLLPPPAHLRPLYYNPTPAPQGPDVYFQMAEAANPFYDAIPGHMEKVGGGAEKAVGWGCEGEATQRIEHPPVPGCSNGKETAQSCL